jgi:hypothetical protein
MVGVGHSHPGLGVFQGSHEVVPSFMVLRGVRGSGRSAAGGASDVAQRLRHGGGSRERIAPPDGLGFRNAGGHRSVMCCASSASHLSSSRRPTRFCQSSLTGRGQRPLAARIHLPASGDAEDLGGTAMLPAFYSNPIPLAGFILLPGSAPHRRAAAGIGGAPGSDPRGSGNRLAGDPAQKDLLCGVAA